MSEKTSENLSLEQLKQAYAIYAFIHQVLTQSTRYNIEEFEVAKAAIKLITETANQLSDTIKEKLPSESKNEEQANNE